MYNKNIRSTSKKVVISLVIIVLIPPSPIVHRGCRGRVSLSLQRSPIAISVQVIPVSPPAIVITITPSLQSVIERPPLTSVLSPVSVRVEVVQIKSLGSSPQSGHCGGSVLFFQTVLVTIRTISWSSVVIFIFIVIIILKWSDLRPWNILDLMLILIIVISVYVGVEINTSLQVLRLPVRISLIIIIFFWYQRVHAKPSGNWFGDFLRWGLLRQFKIALLQQRGKTPAGDSFDGT